MSTTSGARPLSEAPSSARLWRAGLLAAAAATLVNALAWVVVQQLGDAGLMVPEQLGGTELMSLPLGLVVGGTLGAALVGAVALRLLGRRGPGGVRAWTALAVAFGLLSPAPPSASMCPSPGSSACSCSTCSPRPPWSGWPASSSRGLRWPRGSRGVRTGSVRSGHSLGQRRPRPDPGVQPIRACASRWSGAAAGAAVPAVAGPGASQ
jgi:hypothetical protein